MTIECPICRSQNASIFDQRERVSILQNRMYDTQRDAFEAPTGRLAMAACVECGFIWNAAFEPTLMKYDPSYENDQSKSAVFKEHLNQRVRRILEAVNRENDCHVVEVGCGQGDFLAQFAASEDASRILLSGFDPAWRGNDRHGPGGSRIFRSIFSRESAAVLDAPPQVVVSRHTIEHIADPVSFLAAIRDACANREVTIYLETPCANWIIDNLQFQDFFYEHCSIFTSASMHRALTRVGLFPKRIEHVFGGQYLWAEATLRSTGMQLAPPVPSLATDRWSEAKARFVADWTAKIEMASRRGPVFVWGVGAKGVTFALLTDPEGKRLAGAVDVNPKKQSRYIPLTAQRVISPDELPSGPFTAIVMNPNYFDEIASWLDANGREATLLSLA